MNSKKSVYLPAVFLLLCILPLTGFTHPGHENQQATFAQGLAHVISGMDHVIFYITLGVLAIVVPVGKRLLLTIAGFVAVCFGGLIASIGAGMTVLLLGAFMLLLFPVILTKHQGSYLVLVLTGLVISSHAITHVYAAGVQSFVYVSGLLIMQVAFVIAGALLGKWLKNKLIATVFAKSNKTLHNI